jgi:non-ribosomal peptide synthetase component F
MGAGGRTRKASGPRRRRTSTGSGRGTRCMRSVDGLDRWFVGAQCNTCWNCLDRHVAGGRADQPALIYDSPISGAQATFTYRELLDEVAACAAVLRDLGAQKGDRVVIYMPMVPEAAIAMLACARIGAVHSVVFGGFAPGELAKRIDDARPKPRHLGLLRPRARPQDRRLQAAARPGHRAGGGQARRLPHPAAPAGRRRPQGRPRP